MPFGPRPDHRIKKDTWQGKMLHQSLAYSANPQTYDRNWSCRFRYFIRFNIFPFFSPSQFNLASLQWTTRGGPSEFAIQDHRLFQFFCWNVSLQASVLMLFTLTETSNSTYYDEFDDSDDFALMVGDFAADILFPTQAILVQWLAANKVSMSLLTSLHLCRILLSVPSALFNCHSARISW